MRKLAPLPRPGAAAERRANGLRVRADTGGAVLVEFLIAFMPVFLFFTGLVQLALLRSAQIITQVAADRTARAASVVLSDDPKHYNGEPPNAAPGGDEAAGTSGSIRYSSIRRAAYLATRPLRASKNVTIEGAFSGGGDDDSGGDAALSVACKGNAGCSYKAGELITVTVKYDYACVVPVGRIVCGADFKNELRAEASMPNFAAAYEY